MKKAENKDIGGLIFDIEPLIFKLESLSSLCLVINNALEGGSTSEEQYYPAIFLLGDQLAELHKKMVEAFTTLKDAYQNQRGSAADEN